MDRRLKIASGISRLIFFSQGYTIQEVKEYREKRRSRSREGSGFDGAARQTKARPREARKDDGAAERIRSGRRSRSRRRSRGEAADDDRFAEGEGVPPASSVKS